MKHYKWIFLFFLLFMMGMIAAEANPPRRLHTPYIGYRTQHSSPYWRVTKKTASGKHTYRRAAWGREQGCAGMYNKQAMKDKAVKRYHFYRPNARG